MFAEQLRLMREPHTQRLVVTAARAVARHTRARARPEMLAHESGGCHSEIWGQFRQSGVFRGNFGGNFR